VNKLNALAALLFLSLFSHAAFAAENQRHKLNYTDGDGSFFVVRYLGTDGKGYRANLAKGQPDLVARYQDLLLQIESRRLILFQEYQEFVATFISTLKEKMETQNTVLKPRRFEKNIRLSDQLDLVINELAAQIPNNVFLQASLNRKNLLSHLEVSRFFKTELLKVSRHFFPHEDEAVLKPNFSEIINLSSYQARAILIETTLAISPTLADKTLNYKNQHSFDSVDRARLASDVAAYYQFYQGMLDMDPNNTYGQRANHGFIFTSEKSYRAEAFEASEAQWEIDRQTRAEERAIRFKNRAIRMQNRKAAVITQAARSSNWALMMAGWTDPNETQEADREALLAAKDVREALADTNQIYRDSLTDALWALRRKHLSSYNVPNETSCSKFYRGR
jgi:hypothetical protein